MTTLQRERAIGGRCLASFVILCVILPLYIVGFAFPDWVHLGNGTRIGLWQVCSMREGDLGCAAITHDERERWFQAVDAMMSLALMTALIGVVTAMLLPVSAGCQFTAGLFGIVGVIVFAVESDYDSVATWRLEWAFYLCAVTSGLFLLNGACFLILHFLTDRTMTSIFPYTSRRHKHVGAPKISAGNDVTIHVIPGQNLVLGTPDGSKSVTIQEFNELSAVSNPA